MKPINYAFAAIVLCASLPMFACASGAADQGGLPNSAVQQDLGQSRQVFVPVAPTRPPSPNPPSIDAAQSHAPPSMGLAGMAQVATAGNPAKGRDFAFDNCRPCHVVAPNQRSITRFSDAPAFPAIANMPSTTPMSLMVWLTNPHPTMPSLVLSPKEAANVIAYIESLRAPASTAK